jgi:chromosome segregation ATPase
MMSYFKTILIAGLTMLTIPVAARDSVQDETEDVSAESEAVMADTQEIKERMAKERAKADQAFQAAVKANQAAAAKKQAAIEQMKQTETDIEQLESDKKRLNADIKKFALETAAVEKVIAENRTKMEKARAEVQTLQQLKSEKAGHFLMLTSQRERLLEEMKRTEDEKVQAEKEFQAAKEQEKKAQQEFDQTKLEQAKTKARLDAYLATLKERYREMQDRKKAVQEEQQKRERENARLEAQTRTGENELEPLKLKKSCRVFEKPTKGSKVITVQEGGTSITKSDEGKTWFSFPLADGRQGYIAKTCF